MTIAEYWRKSRDGIVDAVRKKAREVEEESEKRREALADVIRCSYISGFMAGKTDYESYELLRAEAESRANAFVDARLPHA